MTFNADEFTFRGNTSGMQVEKKYWFRVTASDGLAADNAYDTFYIDLIYEVPVADTTVPSL